MTIDIQIKDQQVITEKTRFIVANSVNVVTARCTFDEEWDGAVKHLVFTNGDVSRTVVVTDGEEFAVPYEVLMAGKLEISAVGFGAHGEKRITTKKMQRPLLVHESGEIRGGEAMEYTPALWEKISAFIGNFAELEVDADSLVEAVNLIAKAGTADDVVLQKDDSGFFQTAEEEGDGAVYYLHDKKTLAESRNIIKLTKDKRHRG